MVCDICMWVKSLFIQLCFILLHHLILIFINFFLYSFIYNLIYSFSDSDSDVSRSSTPELILNNGESHDAFPLELGGPVKTKIGFGFKLSKVYEVSGKGNIETIKRIHELNIVISVCTL